MFRVILFVLFCVGLGTIARSEPAEVIVGKAYARDGDEGATRTTTGPAGVSGANVNLAAGDTEFKALLIWLKLRHSTCLSVEKIARSPDYPWHGRGGFISFPRARARDSPEQSRVIAKGLCRYPGSTQVRKSPASVKIVICAFSGLREPNEVYNGQAVSSGAVLA